MLQFEEGVEHDLTGRLAYRLRSGPESNACVKNCAKKQTGP